jgi:hypothetical protein
MFLPENIELVDLNPHTEPNLIADAIEMYGLLDYLLVYRLSHRFVNEEVSTIIHHRCSFYMHIKDCWCTMKQGQQQDSIAFYKTKHPFCT